MSSSHDKKITTPVAELRMTSKGHDASLSQLEREAARNRAELIGTIGALQDRLSPSAIKEDVRHYVQDKSEGLLRSLEQRARQNPLQAIAIAGAVAYPLWRVVTSMPAPLLLIGAGLALARTRGGSGGPQGWVGKASARLGEATDGVRQTAEQAAETVQETVQQTMRSAREVAQQASSKIAAMQSQAAEGMETIAGTGTGYRSPMDTAERLGGQVQQVGERAQKTFAETVQRHPVMVGAIGLAIGGIVAAALPVTRPEEEILGGAAGELKRKAKDLAAENLNAVKETANEIYQETVAEAKEQGLSSAGVKDAAGIIGNKLKEVASSAKEAAFPGSTPLKDQPKAS